MVGLWQKRPQAIIAKLTQVEVLNTTGAKPGEMQPTCWKSSGRGTDKIRTKNATESLFEIIENVWNMSFVVTCE